MSVMLPEAAGLGALPQPPGDPAGVRQAARLFDASQQALQNHRATLSRQVNAAVPEAWTGEAATAFQASGVALTERVEVAVSAFQQTVVVLNRLADQLEEAHARAGAAATTGERLAGEMGALQQRAEGAAGPGGDPASARRVADAADGLRSEAAAVTAAANAATQQAEAAIRYAARELEQIVAMAPGATVAAEGGVALAGTGGLPGANTPPANFLNELTERSKYVKAFVADPIALAANRLELMAAQAARRGASALAEALNSYRHVVQPVISQPGATRQTIRAAHEAWLRVLGRRLPYDQRVAAISTVRQIGEEHIDSADKAALNFFQQAQDAKLGQRLLRSAGRSAGIVGLVFDANTLVRGSQYDGVRGAIDTAFAGAGIAAFGVMAIGFAATPPGAAFVAAVAIGSAAWGIGNALWDIGGAYLEANPQIGEFITDRAEGVAEDVVGGMQTFGRGIHGGLETLGELFD